MRAKTSQELTALYGEIKAAHDAVTMRTFRAKYPGTCIVCGHAFRTPIEIVFKVGVGRICCRECKIIATEYGPGNKNDPNKEER